MENLTLQEIRLVADLRLLHSAANNLLGIIGQIKTRHSQGKVEELADPVALLGLKQHSASRSWRRCLAFLCLPPLPPAGPLSCPDITECGG
jgi:hypothetical protein